jgi:mannose-6-phosphate isomerase-like protein (cupin superfamily)
VKQYGAQCFRGRITGLILRKFDDCVEQDVDALLGSLSLGIKNKWLVGKEQEKGIGKLSFALKYSVIEPGKLYPMHPNEHVEVTFILDGNGIINSEKEVLEVKTGDIILTRCGEMHSIANSGKTDLKTLSCIDLLSHL